LELCRSAIYICFSCFGYKSTWSKLIGVLKHVRYMKLICVIGNSVPWKHYRHTTLYEVKHHLLLQNKVEILNFQHVCCELQSSKCWSLNVNIFMSPTCCLHMFQRCECSVDCNNNKLNIYIVWWHEYINVQRPTLRTL
jgi:hypothetical protein